MPKRRGYTETASKQLDGAVDLGAKASGVSPTPTPYLVHCREHGKVFLTEEEHTRQLRQPDALWVCPKCGRVAKWDDDNYEEKIYGSNKEE